ncbi:acyltransferase family protein [Kitasatospora aureofaciens]|uniref:acyltransferase family protein n=1 Tax=Kitasatospora aureofaciens TaxID=1894 RepID=UPI003822FEE6
MTVSATTGTERAAAARVASAAPPAGRLPALDGLRALAVLAVIAFHFDLGLGGGFLGVDLFFVLSGFVITRLLLIEHASRGRISLGRFWTRRARRLFPAVLALLAVTQLWMRLSATHSLRLTTNAQTLAALVYGSNWYAIFGNVGYWGTAMTDAPLNHLWSLAVEEQFYLCWPMVFAGVAAFARSRTVLGAVAALGAAASFALAITQWSGDDPDRSYLGTDTRAAALFLGILVAVITVRARPCAEGCWDRRVPAHRARSAAVLTAAAAVALGMLWVTTRMGRPALHSWQLPLAGLAAALLIATVAASGTSPVARVLASRPLVAVGAISYSLYLWHWPVWVFLRRLWPAWDGPQVAVVALPVSFVLAAASYALVENPIRHGRARTTTVVVGLLLVALLLAVSCAFFQPAPPVAQQSGIVVGLRAPTPTG